MSSIGEGLASLTWFSSRCAQRNPLKKLGTFSRQDSQQYASAANESTSAVHVSASNPNLNDLEIHIQEMAKLDLECKKILKHTKKLTENIAAMSRYQIKISEDLSSSDLCKEYCDDLRVLFVVAIVLIVLS